jgi:hypothetical protein
MKFNSFNTDPDFNKRRALAFKEKEEDPNGGNRDFLFKEKVPNFTPHDGENIIRLLPATWDEAMFAWREVWVHYSIGPNNGQFFCPAKMGVGPCPVCEEGKRMTEEGLDAEKIRPFYAAHRAAAWLIDRAEPVKGPQLWVMPFKNIAQQIIKISKKRSGDYVFVDNIEHGWDIIFSKQGKNLTTKYDGLRKDDDESPLHSDKQTAEKWLTFIVEKSIPELMQFKSYEHIKSVLNGVQPITEEGSKPITTTVKKKASAPKETHSNGNGSTEITRDDLGQMNRDALVAFIDSRDDLDIDVDTWPSDDDLREAIAMDLNL